MGVETVFYIGLTAAVAGTAVAVDAQIKESEERQRILAAELRATELAALDEENQRLQNLREANDSILAHAGGIDAFASASLVAARAFNFRMTGQDNANARLNLLTDRVNTATQISILKNNQRAAKVGGILQIGGQLASGISTGKTTFGKTPLKTGTPPILKKKKTTKTQKGS